MNTIVILLTSVVNTEVNKRYKHTPVDNILFANCLCRAPISMSSNL